VRARILKPEFFTDKKVGKLSPTARLMFLGMGTLCDDGWVCHAEPEYLKPALFLYAPEDILEITRGLQELSVADRIRLIRVGDDLFAFLPRMARNCPINHPSKFRHLGHLHAQLTQEALEGSSKLLEGYSSNTNTNTELPKEHKQQKRSVTPQTKNTWVTPWWDAWLEKYHGDPPSGELCKTIKGLQKKGHSDLLILDAWKAYLDDTEGRFASPSRFAQTFGVWAGTAKSRGDELAFPNYPVDD